MTPRTALSSVFVAAQLLLLAPPASAEPAPSQSSLKKSVLRSMEDENIEAKAGYRIDPSVIQLRNYVDPNAHEATSFCVVNLAFSTRDRGFVGSVRGSATVTGGSKEKALDAAVRSAVRALPDTILRDEGRPSEPYAQR